MATPLQLQSFTIDKHTITLYVPQPEHVKELYREQVKKNASTAFPYWTKIWPAAIALTQFLLQNTFYIQNKKLLELAAGLGLPSIAAARFAQTVCCSDYLEEAVAVMQQSINHRQLNNVTCTVINWEQLPQDLEADVLLLSDINYDPAAFNILYKVLAHFISKGTVVLLSTPQRLASKPFIERLLPWCTRQEEMEIVQQHETVPVTILVLKQ